MKKLLIVSLLSLFLGLVFHIDLIHKHFFTPEGRVTAPIQSSRAQLGDQHYYYILSKKAVSKINPFGHNDNISVFAEKNSGLETVLFGATLTAGILDQFAKLLPIEWNLQVSASVILQTSFLALCVMIFFQAATNSRVPNYRSAVLFGFAWMLLTYGVIRGIYLGRLDYVFTANPFADYPDFLRLVNPQIGWAMGLLYFARLLKTDERHNQRSFYTTMLFSATLAFFSLPLSITFIAGLGIYVLLKRLLEKKWESQLIGFSVALALSFAMNYYLLIQFQQTPKGLELNTGGFKQLTFNIHYMWTFLFLPFIWWLTNNRHRLLFVSLFVAAIFIGVLCNSVELGGRIWLRGSGIIVHTIIILTIYCAISACARRLATVGWTINLAKWAIVPLIAVITYKLMPMSADDWHYNMSASKAELVEWINENTKPASLVASVDLEDVYYIPVYTHAQPLIEMYDYSTSSVLDTLSWYMALLEATGNKEQVLNGIQKYDKRQRGKVVNSVRAISTQRVSYDDYQAYAFYAALLYYPYARSYKEILDSETAQKGLVDALSIRSKTDSFLLSERVDYLVDYNQMHTQIEGFRVVFKGNGYLIYESARLSRSQSN